MPKKKKLTNPKRREARLQKARQWGLTYEENHIVHAYHKHFKVDITCALKDLGEIGVLDPERLAEMKQAEAARLKKRRKAREEKALRDAEDEIRFGIYTYSHEDSSFKAAFTHMKITECKWLVYDGRIQTKNAEITSNK